MQGVQEADGSLNERFPVASRCWQDLLKLFTWKGVRCAWVSVLLMEQNMSYLLSVLQRVEVFLFVRSG